MFNSVFIMIKVPPEFVVLFTDVGGEKRFAASLASRLEALGALGSGALSALCADMCLPCAAHRWESSRRGGPFELPARPHPGQ